MDFVLPGPGPWPMFLGAAAPDDESPACVAEAASDGAFALRLAREPAQALDAAAHPFALQLSGHTNGGQVTFPLLGAPVLPPGSLGVASGWAKVAGLPLYVTRGIGTSILRLRLFTPPEIVLLKLRRPAGADSRRAAVSIQAADRGHPDRHVRTIDFSL